MINREISNKLGIILVMLVLVLSSCQPEATPTAEQVVETLVVTEVIVATPVEVVKAVTPTPEPSGPRTLVICQGQEPETLYPYGGAMLAKSHILEAISEGGWGAYDMNSYGYQATILEKLPNLADGDASLEAVTVSEGDVVVDADGNVVSLDAAAGVSLIPAGGGDPVLYEGGEFEMDQLSATFSLLPDLMWSDGTPLTATDSIYAFNLLADPDTPQQKFTIERTDSYEAVDDLTVVWTGLPGFLDSEYYINFYGPAPEHAWGAFSAAELLTLDESSLAPLGWGPYVIDEWIQGDSVRLHKNPNYYRADEGLPRFENLVYRFVGQNANTNIAALLTGECDILSQLTGLDGQLELILEMHATGQVNATFTTGTGWSLMSLGIQHIDYDDGYEQQTDRLDYFSDVRTRKALAYCLDRQGIVDTIAYGQTRVMDSYVPVEHPLYNPDVVRYDFDVAAGVELLEEVGWIDQDGDPVTPRTAEGVSGVPDGTGLELSLAAVSVPVVELFIEIARESMGECGIQVNALYYPRTEYFADGPEGDLFGRQFDLAYLGWITGVTPPCDLYLSDLTPGRAGDKWISILDGKERSFGISGWGGQNNSGFADMDYDAACSTALSSLPGQPEYEAAHKEAQYIFADQLPVIPVYQGIKLAATRPDMCGFIMDPTANSEFWNIEEFDYGEGCEE